LANYKNWQTTKGEIISCDGKLKILNQNLDELKSLKLPFNKLKQTKEFAYALEDAILFGISEEFFTKYLQDEMEYEK
jgi:hypothetical protein